MKEHIRSAVLSVLVIISLILSWLIWNGTPSVSLVNTPVVIQNPWSGGGKTVPQLTVPRRMVAGTGNDRFFVIRPFSALYNNVMDELAKAYAQDYAAQPYSGTPILQGGQAGIELDFGEPLPTRVITEMTPVTASLDTQLLIQKMALVIADDGQSVKGEAVTTDNQLIVFHVSLSERDLRNWLVKASGLPVNQAVHSTGATYYITAAPSKASQLMVKTTHLSSSQFVDSFFTDPTLMKKIEEADGSVIYTDGSQGVRLTNSQTYIEYTNPSYGQRTYSLTSQGLERSVSFLNSHGGFPKECLIFGGTSANKSGLSQILVRQYIKELPVIGEEGLLQVRLSDQGVTDMARSTTMIDQIESEKEVPIVPSSSIAQKASQELVKSHPVFTDVFLAYLPEFLDKEHMQVQPVWVVQEANQMLRIYDAVSGAFLMETEAGLNGLG